MAPAHKNLFLIPRSETVLVDGLRIGSLGGHHYPLVVDAARDAVAAQAPRQRCLARRPRGQVSKARNPLLGNRLPVIRWRGHWQPGGLVQARQPQHVAEDSRVLADVHRHTRSVASQCGQPRPIERGAQGDASPFYFQRSPAHKADDPRGAAMLADKDLQKMYDLARALHPDDGVALSVTLEACDRIALIRRIQDRRTGHYRRRLPEACLPQYCVYLASDMREREQEHPRSGKDPRYRPTPEDWLVRYVKFLVWQTMDKNACHVAVALGCFLHGYQPGDIANLAPEFFNPHNIRRVKRRLAHQIKSRFQHANIMIGRQNMLRTRPPTDHERRLVHQSLAMFTPWGSPHVPPPVPSVSILETHFGWASARSDWERIHALIDPRCAGLSQLIRDYNNHLPRGSDVRLDDPDRKLKIPHFNP
jgi:hypothetical protein